MEDKYYKDVDSSTTLNKTRESHYSEGSITDKARELQRDLKKEVKLMQQTMERFHIIQSTNFQEQLWNEAGPTIDGMIQKLGHMKEEVELIKKGKERDTKQLSNRLLTLLYQDLGYVEGDWIEANKLTGHMD